MPVPRPRRSLLLGAALLSCAATAPAALAGGGGAVFTTDAAGLAVNENLFAAAEDVHLNGGPPCGAAARAAGLADGWYVFRVTDPSGRVDMTADEPLAERRFRVRARAVVETADPVDHPIRTTACGAVLRVGPFTAGSANGVYKLWVAPDRASARRAGKRGRGGVFDPCRSKTDNFRLVTGDSGGDNGGGEYLMPAPEPPAATPPSAGTGRPAKPARPGKSRPPCRGGGGPTDPAPAPDPGPTL